MIRSACTDELQEARLLGRFEGQGEERHARGCLGLSDSVDDGVGVCKRYSKTRRNIVERFLVPQEIAIRLDGDRLAQERRFRSWHEVTTGAEQRRDRAETLAGL